MFLRVRVKIITFEFCGESIFVGGIGKCHTNPSDVGRINSCFNFANDMTARKKYKRNLDWRPTQRDNLNFICSGN
jgi:hypothetical protein